MADIVLAECNGQAWLVGGGRHVDDLLANTLAAHLTVAVVACASLAELEALHAELDGVGTDRWLIHPAIADRVRGASGVGEVRFAPWSALLDEAAGRIIAAAAERARRDGGTVVLIRFVPAGSPRPLRDLADLRTSLIEAELLAAGIAAGRLAHQTDTAADGDRIGLRVGSG